MDTELELLNQELERHLQELSETNAGSEDARHIIDDYVTLAKISLDKNRLRIEAQKNEMDEKLEREKLNNQKKVEEDKLKEEHKRGIREFWGSMIGHVISAGGIGVTVWATLTNNKYDFRRLLRILKFEQTGSIGSFGGKTAISSMGRRK